MSDKRPFRKAFGRRTAQGVKKIKNTIHDIASPIKSTLDSNRPTIQRKIVSQLELDKWQHDFIQKSFLPFQSLTKEKRDAQAAEPQHFENNATNQKWKQSREHKVSGTKASKLTNLHDYITFEDGMLDILWNKFEIKLKRNPAIAWKVKWGHDLEPKAAATSLEFFNSKTGKAFLNQFSKNLTSPCVKVEHKEYGFVQSIALPFIGSSPDGVMKCTYKDGTIRRHAIEFKCKTKGWFKNEWPTNEWPQGPLYPMKQMPNNLRLPIPTAYFVQIMWCVLVMGKHDLKSLLKIKSYSKHYEAFRQYLEPHLKHAKSQFFGEDMLDTSTHIMFGVWAPGNTDTPHQGEPEIYNKFCLNKTTNIYESIMVKCPSGCLNLTMVKYDHEFAVKTMQHAYYMWRTHWIPRLAMKTKGMLLYDELDPPMNCYTDTESDSDTESIESCFEEEEDKEKNLF